jgi:hypothetical protein
MENAALEEAFRRKARILMAVICDDYSKNSNYYSPKRNPGGRLPRMT